MSSAPSQFSDAFFDALGAWQKGWLEDPSLQGPIREALLREAARIDRKYRLPPKVMFRKRHLYKVDMLPLFGQQAIDDGACSWTTSRAFADRFKDAWRSEAITGAILRHYPRPQDIILNIPLLWKDPEFVRRLGEYEEAGGACAGAIRHFTGENDQFEVIASSPLILSDIIRFSGKVGELEPLIEQAGISDEAGVERAFRDLGQLGIYEGSEMKLWDDKAQRIVARVLERFVQRLRELNEPSSDDPRVG